MDANILCKLASQVNNHKCLLGPEVTWSFRQAIQWGHPSRLDLIRTSVVVAGAAHLLGAWLRSIVTKNTREMLELGGWVGVRTVCNLLERPHLLSPHQTN